MTQQLTTPAEVGATTRAKRAGLARGQQFTPSPQTSRGRRGRPARAGFSPDAAAQTSSERVQP